jgi:hypothetical protein
VYVSKATHEVSNQTLLDIQAEAIRANSRLDVTGVLFYGDGWFLQLLEGPRPVVASVFGRIVLDPRHRQASVLHSAAAPDRLATDWSMGVVDIGGSVKPTSMLEMLPHFENEVGHSSERDPVWQLVEAFERIANPQAA